MAVSKAFVKRLLESFLTGFGIAAGVSLFIVPMTSRTIVSKQLAGFISLLKVSMKAQGRYMSKVSQSHREAQDRSKSPEPVGAGETKPNSEHRTEEVR